MLMTERPLVIDVGAAGKGYLVDILSGMIVHAGLAQFVVDASGDLCHSGPNPLRIGLEHPCDPTQVIGVANLRNRALCASATNRRAWGKGLHHVLDGRTGTPTRDVVATWVVAENALSADGLATALFFVDADQLTTLPGFSYVRMFADGRAEIAPDFEGEIFK
jgi:FAD:protein FMN transferase